MTLFLYLDSTFDLSITIDSKIAALFYLKDSIYTNYLFNNQHNVISNKLITNK